MECSPFNIKVMHVAPGGVESNISKNAATQFISLSPESLYTEYLPDIIRRLNVSQEPGKMPGKEFARRVVSRALRKEPPRFYTLAKNSTAFEIMKWLPRAWVLWYMWRLFSKKA
jgi:1-acylglycerone phosphate reductase